MSFPSTIKWKYQRHHEQDINEYRFQSKIPSESLSFTIKMRNIDCQKIFYNIYLLSSKSLSIRCCLYFLNTKKEEFVITKTKMENFTLECNKWQYINISNISITSMALLVFTYGINKNEEVLSRKVGNIYSTLLRRGEFSDMVTIKSIEGQEHKVHKAMLTSRSEVLKAHFEHDTTESNTNVLESPLENQVLVDFLAFIYCDSAPNIELEGMPEKLLVAADYYQLNELKSFCEEKLKEKLCVDNALNTLQLADLHSLETLKQFALEYIKHEIKLIIKTEGWAKMEPTRILKDIIEYFHVDRKIVYYIK